MNKKALLTMLALLALTGCTSTQHASMNAAETQYASEAFSTKLNNSIQLMPQRSRDRLTILGSQGTQEEKASFVAAKEYTFPIRLENIYRASTKQSLIPSDKAILNARNCHRVCEIRDDCPNNTCCQVCWTECECSPGYAC